MNSQRLSDADLDRLADLLPLTDGDDGPLPLDAIQGLLCAVASAPKPIPPATWLPEVFGSGHKFATPEDEKEATRLLERFLEDVAAQLNGGESLDMVLYDMEDGGDSLPVWCEGYLMGVDLADPPWEALADEDELGEMLGPFFMLSGRAREIAETEGDPWMSEEEEAQAMEEDAKGLVDLILGNRAYWFSKSVPDTIRRSAPKVGRNDPCHCGSGKKFKNCHGAA